MDSDVQFSQDEAQCDILDDIPVSIRNQALSLRMLPETIFRFPKPKLKLFWNPETSPKLVELVRNW